MKPEADKPGLPDNLRALALAARARVQKLPAVGPVVAEQGTNHGYLESPYAEDDWELWACLLLDAFGTRSPNVANAFMSQLADLCPDVWVEGECQGLDAYKFEQVVAIVKAMKPRNEAEAALACQAAALHLATMKVGSRLSQSSYVDPRSAASLAMLGKAYARQLETLSAMQGTRKSVRQVIKVEKSVTLNYSREEKHVHLRGRGEDIPDHQPMERVANAPAREMPQCLQNAPRCQARARSGPCRSPAVRGKRVCRSHGGAKGSGAPKGPANGSYRHGGFTAEAIDLRREVAALLRAVRKGTRNA